MVTTFQLTVEDDPQVKRRSRIYAAIVSGSVLLILLLIFIFWTFVTPIPAIKPDPEPIALEIGLVDGSGGDAVTQGGGSQGNTGLPGQPETSPQTDPQPSPPSSGSVTDPTSDNPAANPTPNPNQPSKEMLAALNAWKKNKGAASINIGGDGKGDPYTGGLGDGSGSDIGPKNGGDPGTGNPGGSNGTSTSGRRIRHILSKPEIVNPTQSEGKVVVNVYVDRTGKVKKTEVNPEGTTTMNSTLRATATQSAYKIVFDADPSGPELLLLPIDIYFTLK